jgi:transposase-like protein
MKFCKHCNYVLNISKTPINNEEKVTYTIETMDQYLNYLKNVSTELNHEVELKIDYETLKSKLMGKFKKNVKKVDDFLKDYETLKNKTVENTNIYFICQNCNSSFEIEPATIILSTNLDISNQQIQNYDLQFKILDPTLPRTKDFICPNTSCESNSESKLDTVDREAVIFRENKSFITRYVCTTCLSDWIAQ